MPTGQFQDAGRVASANLRPCDDAQTLRASCIACVRSPTEWPSLGELWVAALGMALATVPVMNSVGTKLRQDHQQLAVLLECLSQAAEASDREGLATTWAELEPRLIGHMDAEERYLLPLVEADHPAEVKQTLLDHAQIRDRRAELGLAIELHAVRCGDIRALIDLLQAHSKHEDEELYVLAGDKVSAAVEHRVVSTLRTALRSALRSAS